MPLPAADVAAVDRWVEALNADMPAHVAAQLKYRAEVHRNAITLFECRTMDPSSSDTSWFEVPFARLRFTRSQGWQLYWSDRNSRFHTYDFVEPMPHVRPLLEEIDSDPTCIFFG
jgi:Protein of unknown function (DUF3024)